MGKDAKKKAYPVIINDGQYLDSTYQMLSNFWDYQRVSPTGRINEKIEHCYGHFTIAKGIKVKVITNTIIISEDADENPIPEVVREIVIL